MATNSGLTGMWWKWTQLGAAPKAMKYEATPVPKFPHNEKMSVSGVRIFSRTMHSDIQFSTKSACFLVMIWSGTASCSTP